MALIPPDAGIRMRLQTESSLVQPLAPIKGIPADLPELQVGQAFTARIQEALPDNTYRALVAGKQLILQLPEGAAPGDALELVVIDRTPRSLIAQRASATAAATIASQPYQYSRISDAGRMIGQLLLPEGDAPQPARLNRGQPLLPQPPTNATELAPTLAKAVSQSGLFYEAHQAQWIAGQRALESLRAEPQGQLPAMPRPVAAPTAGSTLAALPGSPMTPAPVAGHQLAAAINLTYDMRQGLQPPAEQPASAASATFRTEAAVSTNDRTLQPPSETQSSPVSQTSIPEEIRPIVQQQLDAVATQRLNWHGQVWPGQVMDWEIERERSEDRTGTTHDSGEDRWSTTLRLTMPQLGTVDATLQFAGNSLRLRMASSSDDATASLRQQAPALVQALADAGIALQSLDIRNET